MKRVASYIASLEPSTTEDPPQILLDLLKEVGWVLCWLIAPQASCGCVTEDCGIRYQQMSLKSLFSLAAGGLTQW